MYPLLHDLFSSDRYAYYCSSRSLTLLYSECFAYSRSVLWLVDVTIAGLIPIISVFDVKFLWGLPFGLLYFYYLRSGIAFAHYQELVGYRNL
jgi:hypothetical protein